LQASRSRATATPRSTSPESTDDRQDDEGAGRLVGIPADLITHSIPRFKDAGYNKHKEKQPMYGTTLYAPGDVRYEELPEPTILKPTDAIIKLSATCICGSDLWPFRGANGVTAPMHMGHEFCGVVVEVGSEVKTVKPGQFVVGSFVLSDNTYPRTLPAVVSTTASDGVETTDTSPSCAAACSGKAIVVASAAAAAPRPKRPRRSMRIALDAALLVVSCVTWSFS
jgi:NADPH:quinone reductase-like Zn-dependent oxidoreductase